MESDNISYTSWYSHRIPAIGSRQLEVNTEKKKNKSYIIHILFAWIFLFILEIVSWQSSTKWNASNLVIQERKAKYFMNLQTMKDLNVSKLSFC